MNTEKRKLLLEEYKNRRPEMGVISYRCIATDESFLGISKDTRADFNSTNAKLSTNFHPNKRLLQLWNQYGPEGFELSVIRVLKYDNPADDHTAELEKLRQECFEENKKSTALWR